MMSVPAINPVLPSSGNQPSKVGSGSSSTSVSPLGLTVPQKIPVIPPQISTSPSKPSISMNHSSVPLSLVHENKITGSQAPASIAKSSDKPKDLSPAKPTSNGVESAAANAKTQHSPTQQSQTQPSQQPPPLPPAQSGGKPEEKPSSEASSSSVTNHADVTVVKPLADDASQKGDPGKAVNSSTDGSDGGATTTSVKVPTTTVEAEQQGPSAEAATGSSEPTVTDAKPVKTEAKAKSGPNKRKREQKADKKEDAPVPEKKPQRIRSQVLPYQSPLPELATFINKSLKEKDAAQKGSDEKLIVFYKNEFLAVRNAENGFYLCQTLQNVYRTSHRIRIRWLSQDKESNTVYTPDFYDLTDIECILTTVALEKLDKNKYKLPQIELERTENILKRALDVEKGVSEKPSVTEEHPDGIDLSLYKDESQLQKPKKRKSSSSPSKRSPKQAKKSSKGGGGGQGDASTSDEGKKKKKRSRTRAKPEKKAPMATKVKAKTGKKGKSDSSGGRDKSKIVDQLKVSPPNEKARVVAKVLRKVEMTPTSSKKTKSKGKTAKSNSKKLDKKSSKTEKPTTNRASERRASIGNSTTTNTTSNSSNNNNSTSSTTTSGTSRKKVGKK